MALVEFSKEAKEDILGMIQTYASEELDRELSGLESQLFLDFLSDKIGPYFYNRALNDARLKIQERMDGIADAIYELEQEV